MLIPAACAATPKVKLAAIAASNTSFLIMLTKSDRERSKVAPPKNLGA